MLTREEAEAALRRNLADTGVPGAYHDVVVKAFLDEALGDEEPLPDRRGRYWPTPKADAALANWDAYRAQESAP
jgi:hypothetical protein